MNVLRSLSRFRFTMTLSSLLLVSGVVTRSIDRRLSPIWRQQIGFAPRDLWAWRIGRLFGSAFVTHGRYAFGRALLAALLIVGSAERRTSTRRVALTFWGAHLATLLIESALIGTAWHLLNWDRAQRPHSVRDVGPSAGIFACLGLLIATLPRKVAAPAGLLISGGLVLTMTNISPVRPALKFVADLAHLIAFPLGLFSRHIGWESNR